MKKCDIAPHRRKCKKWNWLSEMKWARLDSLLFIMQFIRLNQSFVNKLTFSWTWMLQVCKICECEPPLSCISKHFVRDFNYLSQTLRIYTYSGIYIKNIGLLIFNMCVCVWKTEWKTRCHSVVIVSIKHRDFRGIISHLFFSTVFYDNRICLYWFFYSGFTNHR